MDVTVSCDGTWQRCGFSSLFGAVFIILDLFWIMQSFVKPVGFGRVKITTVKCTLHGKMSMRSLAGKFLMELWNQKEPLTFSPDQ